ncbi:MAG: hypothetical protein ABI042_17805 [Verrucomicrobiota bacterium]
MTAGFTSRSAITAQGTRNIYDVAIDPLMNIFTCDNTNDGDEWNLRLSHMIQTANYGYPSLFKNFSDEIMPTMKDYGGGSPTGALFVDEPGFPDEFGRSLYTCQWGWNSVMRHPLKKSGATFSADKETFIRIPRPTGIAADGNGNIYVASWKGATFSYEGENVGFVARVAPLNYQSPPFPNLQKVSDKKLFEWLASPSATRRLHVQREILRRDPQPGFIKNLSALASSSRDLSIRAAAIFTLGQIQNPSAIKSLIKLSGNPELREIALRALTVSTNVPAKIFVDGLKDKNPAVRLQSIIALNQLNKTETAGQIFPLTMDTDLAISHAAFRALVSFRAVDVCFKTIDKSDAASANSALRILGNLHERRVVGGLIERLKTASQLKPQILETLCRLYYREADWDGSWWTTRPDISGPYYKPVKWEGTEKIAGVLRGLLEKRGDQCTFYVLVFLIQKYKIESPEIPAADLEWLILNSQIDPALCKKAFQNLTRTSDEAAIHAILACATKEKFTTQLRDEFVHDSQRAKNLKLFVKLANAGSESESELAYLVLLNVVHNATADAPAKSLAQQTIDAGKNSLGLQPARASSHFVEDRVAPVAPSTNANAKLAYEEVLKQVAAAQGDAKIGAKIFETVGCAKCHTVLKSETPKGPLLGDITARYTRSEILESILRPSAKIAQGFESITIDTKEGDSFDGFIVRESGDEVELRNLNGATVIPKKNIALRKTRTVSIMPEGMVDSLSPQDLGCLLEYLQSVLPKP